MIPALVLLAAAQTLTLADVEKNTRANLPSIHIAQAQTAVQRALRGQSAANYLPQITASAFDFLETETFGQSLNFGNRLGAQLGVTQLIYDFNQTSGRTSAADANVKAAQEAERGTWNSALLTARSAYFTAQGDRELIRVAQATLDSQQKHVEQMAAFVQHGTHAPIDLAQAQQQRAVAQYQLVQARGAYGQSKAALQLAMGLDRSPDYDVGEDVFPPVEGEEKTTDELLLEALNARPEVTNLRNQVHAQELIINVSEAAWLPSISGSGTLGGAIFSQIIPAGGTHFLPTAQVGVALNWPFYTGGRTRAVADQAEAQLVILQGQLEQVQQQVRNDVDVAKVALSTSTEQLASAREALRFAQEQLKLAEGQYAAGVGIALAVFDAQVAVTTSGGQVAQSVAAQAIARAQLLRALGREKY